MHAHVRFIAHIVLLKPPQASQVLDNIGRELPSRAVATKEPALPPDVPPASSQFFDGSAKQIAEGALELKWPDSPRVLVLHESEPRMQALTWLDGQERSEQNVEDGPTHQSPPFRSPAMSFLNSAAATRARTLRQAYKTLGVHRGISDSDLDRMYATLLRREKPYDTENPHNNELREAYACVRSNRRYGGRNTPADALNLTQ